jgi:lipopolysaccharide biosynthesis glycosyltransferase
MPPLLHYIREGEAMDLRPNLVFLPDHYAQHAGLPEPAGALRDFLRMGQISGLEPSPHFDPMWYRQTHAELRGAEALGHYLANRHRLSPNAWFDRARYAAGSGQPPDSDLYAHFALIGVWSGLTRHASQRPIPEPVLEDMEALRAEQPSLPAALPAARPAARPAKPAPARPAAVLAKPASPAKPVAPPAKPVAPAKPTGVAKPAASAPAPPPPAEPPPAPPPAPRLPSLAELGQLNITQLAEWARALPAALRDDARVQAAEGLAETGEALTPFLVLYLLGGAGGGPIADASLAPALVERATALPEAGRRELGALIANETHRAFEAGARAEAAGTYAALRSAGLHDQLALLRLLEMALLEGDLSRGQLLGEELEQAHEGQLSPWAVFALSRLHEALGRPARGIAMLRALPSFPAIPANAEAVAAFRLIELDAIAVAEERLDEAERLPAEDALAPRFRIAVRKSDTVALREFVGSSSIEKLPDWLLTEAMFLLTADGFAATREGQRLLRGLNRALEGRGLVSNAVVQARLHYLLQTRQFEAMGALLEEISATPFAALRDTRLRQLEYLCNIGETKAADALYREVFKGDSLGKWEGLVILRLLSDQKDWPEAGGVLLSHVARGHDFAEAQHGAMRVVRRARLHEQVLALEPGLGETVNEGLKAFFALVQEDQTLIENERGARAERGPPRRRIAYRSNWLIHPADAEPPSSEHCLFLCTNERYFLSLLTFLCSYIGQSPQVNASIFVFLDKDVPRPWIAALKAVGEHFKRDITVVDEAAFMPEEVEHQEEYGFFAGGSGLSRAAYFRLYAARYLLEKFSFRRAAYVDTDIICRGDLTGLLEIDMRDALLFAATEEISPHVVSAATRNGLDPWRYFNSGVLLLRFDDPRLRTHIEEAIRVSEEEPQRLAFHDQCALNIAFNGQAGELPRRFNYFLRPTRERNGHIEEGLMLHFLDKPKPWDISFDKPYREEWRVWAVLLGLIVPRSLYATIFAAANRE